MADQNYEAEIILLPFLGQGHLFPFIELTKHLSNATSLNFTTTLLLPSSLSSSIPASLLCHRHHIRIAEIPSLASPLNQRPGPGPLGQLQVQLRQGIESLLSARPGPARPICAVIDVMMGWARPAFDEFGVPVVVLFTSGACSAAVEYGLWKARASDLKPGETRVILGLPEEMAVSYSDFMRQAHYHPPPHGGPPVPGLERGGTPGLGFKGAPGPGQRPPWVDEVEGTVAVLINTCQEMEGPFLDYLARQLGKPVWGVGPLLPEECWKSTSTPVHDCEIRANKPSNYTEEEVIQWLDSKPHGSVLYVSFGSEVGPTVDECSQLARALEEIDRPFIWVIRHSSENPGPPAHLAGAQCGPAPEEGCYTQGLECKVGERGLLIRGWAPQLLILTHPSTGGFLSHCGWNSIVEAIGRAVPILAWPIRGDQHHNAKLVVCHLKVGYMIKEDCVLSNMVKKDEIVRGIEKIMTAEGIRQHVDGLRSMFEGGFPASSSAALESLGGIEYNASQAGSVVDKSYYDMSKMLPYGSLGYRDSSVIILELTANKDVTIFALERLLHFEELHSSLMTSTWGRKSKTTSMRTLQKNILSLLGCLSWTIWVRILQVNATIIPLGSRETNKMMPIVEVML
ncbi:hypothetical protein Cgig2_008880 [Carnegiea gigantea]|uniref:2-hydroxyflavanone C-glucosyltransferase n=1 Tax=Carnegiea gigantea TaxID=171969 RepID=A0A9Q1JP28_9CARY|nr:hypothetical protein Cgig2_008880 [Carnegiea gigantea]